MKRKNILIIAAIILIVLLLIAKCNCRTETKTAERCVNPPVPEADIPYKDYVVEAEKGDTIIFPSGTILLFPKDAFVDKHGKLIQGKVDIKYREFNNPADQFLSGIPMGYDSAGVHYTFESAGMCDIQAFKNGQPVFVNKKNKPEINMASQNKDLAQNLYYLDTVSGKWINRGKSEILELGKKTITIASPKPEESNIPKPVKPSLLDESLPLIKVIIDSNSFEELKAYHHLQFQIDKTESRFDPEASHTRWSDVQLKKSKIHGLYIIKFTSEYGDRIQSVEYKVRPVLSDKDYAKAMLLYDKQMASYERKIEAKLAANKANKEAYVKDSLNNAIIDKENEKTARLNKIIEAKNAEIEAQNKIVEAKNMEITNVEMTRSVIRNFEIDGFGIWNVDKPMSPDNFIAVNPLFVDTEGKEIEVYSANLVVKNLNAIYRIAGSKVEVPRDKEIMMLGVSNGRFAYITYEEFKKLNITSETTTQTFSMNIVAKENNNYDFIQSNVRE
jgi:hypothetical protein